MVKKRNNTAKKKKATKKQKLSVAFGVSVLKGGTISRNNGVIDNISFSDGHQAQSKNKKGKKNAVDNTSSSAVAQISHNEQVSRHVVQGNQPSKNHENDEFMRLHASLEERSIALHSRKKEFQKKKKGRHVQKKGWEKFAHPSTKVDFTPATLNLGQKSTEQLINETANHVAMGMTEIGHCAARNHGAASIPGQSSLAVAAGLNWKIQLSNMNYSAQQEQSKEQSNPFAALNEDSDSDSDNVWAVTKSDSMPQIQFQPASFSFQPAPSVMQQTEDVDPDL